MLLVLGLAHPAHAVDGVIEINQSKALAGGVTASDTPGFPVTLATGESYVLTSNLNAAGAPAATALLAADDVTIDLNGFEIVGPHVCTGQGSGISCPNVGSGDGIGGLPTNVAVKNGTVRGFGRGIWVTSRSRIEQVNVRENRLAGISMGGRGHIVRDCVVERNGAEGIWVNIQSVVTGNTATGNGNHGIRCDADCTIRENTAVDNGGNGIQASRSVVTGNVASLNTGDGINSGSSAVTNNVITLNGGDGINAGSAALVVGNAVSSNTGTGIVLIGTSGYGQNVVNNNSGGTISAAVSQLGINVCDANTTCP